MRRCTASLIQLRTYVRAFIRSLRALPKEKNPALTSEVIEVNYTIYKSKLYNIKSESYTIYER